MTLQGMDLEDVAFSIRGKALLAKQSFELVQGGGLAITGDNGVGKSTLLKICAGLVRPHEGIVRLAGMDMATLAPTEAVRQGIRRGVVLEGSGLLSNLSAFDNVMLPLLYFASLTGRSEADCETLTREVLDRLRIDAQDYQQRPATLSTGIRRRVALARALAIEPNFLFVDSPEEAVDEDSFAVLTQILKDFRGKGTATVIVVTNRTDLIWELDLMPVELAAGELVGRLSKANIAPFTALKG